METEDKNAEDFRFVLINQRLEAIMKTTPLRSFINEQYLRYTGHICRAENYNLPKIMFADSTQQYFRDP